jgi:hypothetical protein
VDLGFGGDATAMYACVQRANKKKHESIGDFEMLRDSKFMRAELRAAAERISAQHMCDCMDNRREEDEILETGAFFKGSRDGMDFHFDMNEQEENGQRRRRHRRRLEDVSVRLAAAVASCRTEAEGVLALFRPSWDGKKIGNDLSAGTITDLRGSLTKWIVDFGSGVFARCRDWQTIDAPRSSGAGDDGDDGDDDVDDDENNKDGNKGTTKSDGCFRVAYRTLENFGVDLDKGEHESLFSMGAKSNAAEALALCVDAGYVETDCLELAERAFLAMSDSEDQWNAEIDLVKSFATNKGKGMASKVKVDLHQATTQLAFAKKPGQGCPTSKSDAIVEALRSAVVRIIGDDDLGTVVTFVGKSTDGETCMLTITTDCVDGNADAVSTKIASKSMSHRKRHRRRHLLDDSLYVRISSSATVVFEAAGPHQDGSGNDPHQDGSGNETHQDSSPGFGGNGGGDALGSGPSEGNVSSDTTAAEDTKEKEKEDTSATTTMVIMVAILGTSISIVVLLRRRRRAKATSRTKITAKRQKQDLIDELMIVPEHSKVMVLPVGLSQLHSAEKKKEKDGEEEEDSASASRRVLATSDSNLDINVLAPSRGLADPSAPSAKMQGILRTRQILMSKLESTRRRVAVESVEGMAEVAAEQRRDIIRGQQGVANQRLQDRLRQRQGMISAEERQQINYSAVVPISPGVHNLDAGALSISYRVQAQARRSSVRLAEKTQMKRVRSDRRLKVRLAARENAK